MADLDVRVLITAAADQLRKELSSAGNSVSSFGQRASASLNAAGDRLVGLGTRFSAGLTLPLAAAGGAAIAMAKRFAAAGDEIAKTAAKVGVGGEALQELRFAAEQSGVAHNTLDMALQRFSRRVGEAAQGGGELAGTLEQYGIAVTDSEGKTRRLEAIFADLADAVAGAGSEQEQLRISFKAFDSEGAALVNLLRGGSGAVGELREQFRELGLGISGETLKASERFTDQWNIVSKQMQAASAAIADQLLPVLVNDLMPVIINRVVPGLIKAGQAVGDLIRWFAGLPAPVQTAAGVIAAAIGLGGPVLIALGIMAKAFAAVIAVATGPIGLFIAAAAAAAAAWSAWGDEIRAIVGTALDWISQALTAYFRWWRRFWGLFFQSFREAFPAAAKVIEDTTTSVTEGAAASWEAMAARLTDEGGAVPTMWDSIAERWAQGADAIGAINEGIVLGTTETFTLMNETLFEIGNRYLERLEEIWGLGAFSLEAINNRLIEHTTLAGESMFEVQNRIWGQLEDRWALGAFSLDAINARLQKAQADRNRAILSNSSQFFSAMASALAAFGSKTVAISKAVGIASALIATYQGIAEAMKLPFPLNFIVAAKVGALGFAQVANIVATDIGTGGAVGSAGGIASSAATPAPAPLPEPNATEPERQQVIQVNIESRRNVFTREDIENLLEQINEALGDNAVLGVR